jgi:glycosyltransferase involved in cell wall biosynthesis
MRILQISSARHFGGGERHFVDLTNGLAERGHDLFVAVLADSPLPEQFKNLSSQNVFHLAFGNALNISSAWSLAKFARDNRIEIIHAHMARDYPLAAVAVGRSGGARLVITRHVLFPLGQIHRLTRRRVSRVIAVSQAVAASLREQNIFDDRAIRVVHNGIDLDRFAFNQRQSSPIDGPLRVGIIGELSPIKAQTDFVRAAALVAAQHSTVQFVIAGKDNSGGAERRELDELIKRLDIQNRTTVDESNIDVPSFLQTLDVFVSASRSEAFGLAIVEAMAAGVPVIATATEGAAEIINDGETGLLTPIGDATQLAQKLNSLLSDPAKRNSLAVNARRDVAERFALDRMIVGTEEVYREALGSDARRT